MRSMWLWVVGGGLCGATMPALLTWLVTYVDESGSELFSPIVFIWWLFVSPGMVLPGHGALTLGFVMAFWAAVGAAVARRSFLQREQRRPLDDGGP